MRVEQTWFTEQGCLNLRMSVHIEGRVYQQDYRQDQRMAYEPAPPIDYIERDMRRRVMAAIEKELFQ